MSSIRENIRLNLTAALKQKKMTQKNLAEALQLSQTAVTNWMKGKNAPDIDTLAKICKILGVTVSDMISAPSAFAISQEIQMLSDKYVMLDSYGKELVCMILDKELERVQQGQPNSHHQLVPDVPETAADNIIAIPFYDLPVSAGTGIYLQDDYKSEIEAEDSPLTRQADFALRISGDSMEPAYHNGDILLIRQQDNLVPGELGIFVLNGNGYFKKLGKNQLISLNPQYAPIPFGQYDTVQCAGKVIGKLEEI